MMQPISFRVRRRVSLALTVLAVLAVWMTARTLEDRLARTALFTGSTVLASLVLLCLIGLRRRIPVLPLGSVSTWTQIHIYTGLFAMGAFLVHVPAVIGGGILECGLAALFWVVSASGVYGIYASRTLPRRLTAVEGQHRFDRVAWHRQQIADTAANILQEVEQQESVEVLGGFYQRYLAPFFGSRPSLAYVLAPGGGRRRRLLTGLRELDRYLEPQSRSTSGKLAALVRRRDDLDYQFALQLRLRLWLIVHGVFSVALLVAGIVHAITAWRYMA